MLKYCDNEFNRDPHIFVEMKKKFKGECIEACHSLGDGKRPEWTNFCAKLTGGGAK